MDRMVDTVMVGIGGYGGGYVKAMSSKQADGARICAVVDPLAAERSTEWPALEEAGVPRFDDMEAFLASGIRADLAVISSPIAFHAEQTCAALRGGADVLCEKPLCARVEEADAMLAARDAAGRRVSIGYQWSFSETIQRLKADIRAGRFGAPRDFRCWISTPRGKRYYARNNWAGRIRDAAGRWVYDSPVNNATAHYLHNMLYLLGPATDRSATPVALTGECYRANPIENFDAACCRVETREGVPVLYFSAHCVDSRGHPVFRYSFDDADIVPGEGQEFIARFRDGRTEDYGTPNGSHNRKLDLAVQWARNGAGEPTLCGIEAAMMHTRCIGGLQRLPVRVFDPESVRRAPFGDGDELTYVEGLDEAIRTGCERGALFSEMGLPWAEPAQRVEL